MHSHEAVLVIRLFSCDLRDIKIATQKNNTYKSTKNDESSMEECLSMSRRWPLIVIGTRKVQFLKQLFKCMWIAAMSQTVAVIL